MSRLRLATLVVIAVLSAAGPALADDDAWFGRDKALHFDACAGVSALTYAVASGWLVDARWKALAIGGATAMAAGAGKELLDATGLFGGDPSWKDLTWDAIGAVAGLALAWGVDMLLGGVSLERPALSSPPAQAQAVTSALSIRF